MNRGQCMEALLALGVDGPEAATNALSTSAVVGVVRWAQDENRKGRAPSSSLIYYKLRNGGLDGYGTAIGPAKEWTATERGRATWVYRNVPDLDPLFAEVAVVSLLTEGRTPNPESVRLYAELAEVQDRDHQARCKEALAATRPATGPKPEGKIKGSLQPLDPKKALAA